MLNVPKILNRQEGGVLPALDLEGFVPLAATKRIYFLKQALEVAKHGEMLHGRLLDPIACRYRFFHHRQRSGEDQKKLWSTAVAQAFLQHPQVHRGHAESYG
jgi:hypothetical protein